MPQEPIAGAFVELMLTGIRRSGGDSATVLRRAGIPVHRLGERDFRVSQEQFTRLLSMLTRATRDEFWSLCDRPVPLGSFRTMCRLLVNCRTLGEAFAAGSRFYRLLASDFMLRLRCNEGIARIRLTDRLGVENRQHVVHGVVMFFLYHLMCWLVDRRLPLVRVDFVYAERPFSLEAAKTYHRAEVRFDQPLTELCIEERWLSLPILPDEQRLSRFLSEVPRNLLLRYRDEHSTSDRVRSMLRRSLDAPPSLEQVADRLHLTPLTLRRRLREEGQQGFQEMRDRVRHEAALDLLQNPHLTLEHIAEHLGFAEHSTFHRAFRRWTGLSPGQFRERLAKRPPSTPAEPRGSDPGSGA